MTDSGRFAFFDVAGTLVAGNPWRGMMKYPAMSKTRVYARYPFILPPWWAKNAGLLPDVQFRQIWIRQMAALLKGMTRNETNALFAWIADEFMGDDYRDDVVARLRQHKADGYTVILISGMFEEMTAKFANHVGADAAVGTELGYQADVCTGRIVGQGCAGDLKLQFLQKYLNARGLQPEHTVSYAYADSYSDVPLLASVGHAVATYPDEKLALVVRERRWETIG